MIHVLDHGYVQQLGHFGSDLQVVNFARATYAKRTDELRPRDVRLLHFLGSARPQHTAPFYSCAIDLGVHAPLMVARQWWKHVVASRHADDPFAAWNEASRRYMTEGVSYYHPEHWRAAPSSEKQGSEGLVDPAASEQADRILGEIHDASADAYEQLLELGVCAEQARLALAAYGLYVSWRWTASLYSVAHFVALRTEETAQGEIQEYARAVAQLAHEQFPNAWEALLSHA